MIETYSQEEMRAYLHDGKPLPVRGEAQPAPRRAPSHTAGKMNKTEARYADRLKLLKISGDIRDFWFERLTLKIGDDCRYTPDFMIVTDLGRIELHEVKGAFVRDDARVKLKVAAEMFPQFQFVFCQLVKGNWIVQPVKRA